MKRTRRDKKTDKNQDKTSRWEILNLEECKSKKRWQENKRIYCELFNKLLSSRSKKLIYMHFYAFGKFLFRISPNIRSMAQFDMANTLFQIYLDRLKMETYV
jgi:hypothetical protein